MQHWSRCRSVVAVVAVAGLAAACMELGHRHARHGASPTTAVAQPASASPMSYYGPPAGWGTAGDIDPRWSPAMSSVSASASATIAVLPPPPIAIGTPPPDATKVPNYYVFATAPATITESDLGRPCDVQFRPIRGEQGMPLYQKKDGMTGAAGMTAKFLEAQNAFDIEANADAWGLGIGGGGGTDRRYVLYRAWEQTDIFQVNDAAAWLHAPPPDAAWYVASIFVGRSWEVLVSGDASKFNAGLRAKVEQFGIAIGKDVKDQNLSWSASGRGLEANSDSDRGMFAETPDAILAAYHRAQPVPIYVEYRNIPGRDVVLPPHLEWAAAPVPDDVRVTPIPLHCTCIGGHRIAMSCPVQNLGGRKVDVTVRAHAVTGTIGDHAEGAGRVRLAPNETADVEINAPISGALFDCGSTAGCGCQLVDFYPVTP